MYKKRAKENKLKSINLLLFFFIDSTGARVEVAKPIVDMDGDEMTRVR